MFDEFFHRRRKNRPMLFFMIGLILLGGILFAAGILYLS
jgi:hypothetical protein